MQQDQRIEEFWKRFLEAKKMDPNTKYIESFHFELTEKWANELLRLVLEGRKRATASSLFAYSQDGQSMPKVGDYSIVTDWDGNPKCVIQTTTVQTIPYSEMTFDVCKREGEDMLIVFEDFQVVYQENESKSPIHPLDFKSPEKSVMMKSFL